MMDRKLGIKVTLPPGHDVATKVAAVKTVVEVVDQATEEVVGKIPTTDLVMLFPIGGVLQVRLETPHFMIVEAEDDGDDA